MKLLLVTVIIFFLLLDWLALDDITTGKEPSFFLEYATLGVSAVVFGAIFLKLGRKRKV